MPTSCSHYFAETIRGASRMGINPSLLLENVGLTPREVFDPNWRGNVEQLSRLVQLVWFALDDEYMGLVGRRTRRGTFAMMTYGIIDSRTLESALRKGILFYDLLEGDLSMSLDVRGETACFAIRFHRPENDPEHYFHEFWLTIWYRFIGWLGAGLVPLSKVTFSYPQPLTYVEEFKYMFRGKHVFDAPETALYFDSSFLARPVVRNREELKRLLSTAPLGFMMVPEDDNSLSRKIRTMLLADRVLPLSLPSIEEVAGTMGLTEQTLRRRLKQEATSYRMIKEDIRRDLAIQKLMEGRITIQEIGFLLGYSEPRAFTRAFHQWTNTGPKEYRLRLHEQFKAR